MKVSRYRKDDDISYALGATVAMEFLVNRPGTVKEVILHPQFRSEETIARIEEISKEAGFGISVEEKPFNILSQKENCFVIAVVEKKTEHIREGNHVVLVNPSNAGNMGTIMRSCAGFGVLDIAVIPPAVDQWDPKTVRASMGAAARVRVEVFDTFDEYMARFPDNRLYPFMLDGSTRLQETKIVGPYSLIFGNEATGLPEAFADIGQPVRIEHTDNIDSLNLPIAASIALYAAAGPKGGRA